MSGPLTLRNGEVAETTRLPLLTPESFGDAVVNRIADGARLCSFFGLPGEGIGIRLIAVLGDDSSSRLEVYSTEVIKTYTALTPRAPAAHVFEREIAEQWGVVPEGHPWLKPLRFHASWKPGFDAWDRETMMPGVTDFYRVEGLEVHEVAVGPVHAGIIEPGHFRFQCHGEQVFHLEIALGYQHRGIERVLPGGPDARTVHLMETLAGDTTIGHSLAYAQTVEALAGCHVPPRAHGVRAIALELERLANHTGDLGALAADVGYLPTSAFCGRIRGDFLNMTALLCGSRFGRGLVRPGGVAFDLEAVRKDDLAVRLERARKEVTQAVDLLWATNSVRARFEETGTLTPAMCRDLGLVGVAARACGLEMDARKDYPSGLFKFFQIPVSTYPSGDVFARAYVRWLEIQRSIEFIQGQLKTLSSAGEVFKAPTSWKESAMVVTLVEGWRGEICHVALTDAEGRVQAYKIVDPSFHNWPGLALALRGQAISDFPLCNKSFNLSYGGHDL